MKSGFSIHSNFLSKIPLGFEKTDSGLRQKNPMKEVTQIYFPKFIFNYLLI